MDDDDLGLGDEDRDVKGGGASDSPPQQARSPMSGGGAAASPQAASHAAPPARGGGGGGGGGAPSTAGGNGGAISAVTGQPLNRDLMVLKVAIVGPKQSGKTVLSNHLSGLQTESKAAADSEKYDPTIGVRILEFERDITARSRDGKQSVDTKVLVELWDVSGDTRFEGCWPAVTRDLLGVIVAFDPKSKQQAAEVKVWAEWFAKNADFDNNQCVIFAHGMSVQLPNFGVKTGKKNLSIPVVNVSTAMPAPAVGSMDGSRKPSSAQLAFSHFLGDTYAFHKLADFA